MVGNLTQDRTWLNNNSPKLKQPKASGSKVDWKVRDEEILAQAKSAIALLLKQDKPVRIIISRISLSLGLKALTETVEDF